MSSKDEILNSIRMNTKTTYDMPEMTMEVIHYPDKVGKFIKNLESVGGKAIELEDNVDINQYIRDIYPEAKTIASNIPGISIANINPDKVESPQELDKTDLAVIKGEIGVAENGCVWISRKIKERALYFISKNLVVLLDKKDIVHTMHDAYESINRNDYDFGVFISGPSKTADIEQALVIGAHGAIEVTVLLQN